MKFSINFTSILATILAIVFYNKGYMNGYILTIFLIYAFDFKVTWRRN